MAAYRQVYDSRHMQVDCQEQGSAPEPYARQSSVGYISAVFTCIGALGTPSRTGPLARKYSPGFLLRLIIAKVKAEN